MGVIQWEHRRPFSPINISKKRGSLSERTFWKWGSLGESKMWKIKRGSFSDRRFENGGQCGRTYPSHIFRECPPPGNCSFVELWRATRLVLLEYLSNLPLITASTSSFGLTLVLLRGVVPTPLTVIALVLRIAQPGGKIAPGTFKFILSLHFSEKISNLPPTQGVG